MGPEVVDAVERLRREGLLSVVADRLGRIARRQLVSVHLELRIALYAGVLLVTAGAGLLVKERLERLGPLAIAAGLTLATLLSLGWVARHVPPFTWGEAGEAHMAFDYILLLGVLLGAADLAYVEARFTPLGPAWPWHLLIVSALSAGIALRCDSRIVFSLALSSFAAWRGVSVSLADGARWLFSDTPGTLRANALGVGILFILVGLLLLWTRRKPHFEPVATPFGCALVLGALFSALDTRIGVGLAWTWATLAAGAALAGWGWRARRFLLLAMGVVGGYVGLSALAHRLDLGDTLMAAWYLATSVGLVIGLFFAHHHLKEDA